MTHQQALEKQAVERYLLEEMPEIERFAFEEHLFGCDVCAEDVRLGALMHDGVAAGLLPVVAAGAAPGGAAAPSPSAAAAREKAAPLASPRKDGQTATVPIAAAAGRKRAAPSVDPRAFVPWAMAAMLALTVGYQTLWVVPGLRDAAIGPTVLAPVSLRGATRGAEPGVVRPAAGVVTFSVDLPGLSAGQQLTYDLRAPGGSSVATGTAAAPSPGSPLLLLVPASSLEEGGGYVLSVSTGDDRAAEYRFTVTTAN